MTAGEVSITFDVAKADEAQVRDVLHRGGFLVRSTPRNGNVHVAAERYVGVALPDADVQRAHHDFAAALLDGAGLTYSIAGTGISVGADSKRLWSAAILGAIPQLEVSTEPRADGLLQADFLGSCFALRHSNAFVTAAHCVAGMASEDLMIECPRAEAPYSVESIEVHPSADVALLRLGDNIWPEGVAPVPSPPPALTMGEDAYGFGFPENAFVEDGPGPTARVFKGHVQRLFDYVGPTRYRYLAAELSFPCPRGLSGGPLFTLQPGVAGLVTESRQSYTAIGREEGVVSEKGEETITLVERDIIHYGVAVVLQDVSEWLSDLLPEEPRKP